MPRLSIIQNVILVTIASIILFYFAYFIERSNFIALTTIYLVLFGLVIWLYQSSDNEKTLLYSGVFLRLILLFSIPNLSNDFYRFIWDGRLLLKGYNVYTHLPDNLMQLSDFQINQKELLYAKMGDLSASHYSNYPPVNQLFFILAGILANKSIMGAVIVFKLLILFADIGIYNFGKKILTRLNLNTKYIFWYFLNPLVLIELTGNLHFEGVMLFFFIWSFYLLQKNRWLHSALILSLSISTKLLPLLLLPLYFQVLGWKKSIGYYAIAIGMSILFFLPFFSFDFVNNYFVTIGLWFVNFEFNASFYYLVREIGFYTHGYNIIQTIGKISPFLILIFVGLMAFLRNNKSHNKLFAAMLWVLTIYFLQSTTIHPWYIVNLVILSVFTAYKFPLMWSVTVILSYSAYTSSGFKENFKLIAIEYVFVIFVMIGELYLKNKGKIKI